jgi:prepilin-type N-terminal cleavage/methylation domain-containing protein
MTSHGRESGFTLLELIISATIVSLLVGVSYGVVVTGASTYSLGSTQGDLEMQAGRTVDSIVSAMAESGADVIGPALEPPYCSSIVTLQRNKGFKDGSIQWGAVQSYSFAYADDDPDDGVDNDGDGLIDEGQLVLVQNPGEASERITVLARNVREYLEGEAPNGKDDNGNGLVDERGLAISFESGVWTVRVTLERLDSKGRTCVRTAETSVSPRN